jgi:hypothetical protein
MTGDIERPAAPLLFKPLAVRLHQAVVQLVGFKPFHQNLSRLSMNTGARLHRIYNRLAAQATDQPMVQTWAEVFDLDKSLPHLEDEVANLVMALRSEIKFARERLDAYGVPANLTSPGFERLTNVASPGQLHSGWNGHRGNIQPSECRKVFEWVEWALREEDEGDMSAEELQDLQSELDSLEASLREADMAPYLREFIQRQVNTIRTALRMYSVQGVKPVEDALQKVAGAYKTQERPLAQAYEAAKPPAKNLFERASGVVDRVAKVSDNLCKIKKAEIGRAHV